MNWLSFIPTLFTFIKVAPQIKQAIDIGAPLSVVLQEAAPEIVPSLETIGAQLFPNAAPAVHAIAAATAAFDPDGTKWLQGALNRLLTPSPRLVVDGIYGPKTRAAVEAAQEKLGLKVDGWAGEVTLAALQYALTKK